MASITSPDTQNTARDAWKSFLNAHPKISGFLSIVASFFGYFLNGHAIVAFVQWLVRVAGRVAESALLLATLYVTLNNIAHTLVTWVLPPSAINGLNYLSLVAFSILPELIVAAAIKVTVDHWMLFARTPKARNVAWVWGVLYAVPTITFLVMTVYTLLGFVQSVAGNGTPAQATGAALTIRLLAGWGYAMIEILFATIGKKSYTATFDHLRMVTETQAHELAGLKSQSEQDRANLLQSQAEVSDLTAKVSAYRAQVSDLQQKVSEAQSQVEVETASARVHVEKLRSQLAEAQAQITSMEDVNNGLKSQLAHARAARRALRAGGAQAMIPERAGTNETMAAPERDQSETAEPSHETGYLARDNGTHMVLTNGTTGETMIATGSRRDQIYQVMRQALIDGETLTYPDIAARIGGGLSTVKRHAPEIKRELEEQVPHLRAGDE